MKHQISILMAMFLIGLVPTSALELNEEAVRSWLDGIPTAAEIAAIPQGQRSDLIEMLRPYLSQRSRLRKTQRVLVELGDRETANQLVVTVRCGPGANAEYDSARLTLGTCSQPWLIPLVVDILFADEKPEIYFVGDADVGTMPKSTAAAYIVYGVLSHSTEFPAETRERANLWLHLTDREAVYRQIIRTWWQENKEHFAKQDYAAVSPLQPVTRTMPPSSRIDTGSPKSMSTVASQVVPKVEAIPNAPATPPAPGEPSTSVSRLWKLPVLVAAVTALIVVIATMKRRKS